MSTRVQIRILLWCAVGILQLQRLLRHVEAMLVARLERLLMFELTNRGLDPRNNLRLLASANDCRYRRHKSPTQIREFPPA